MRILVDTHIILWAAANQVSEKVKSILENPNNTLYFSSASIWEIEIKNSRGKEDFNVDAKRLCLNLRFAGYEELGIISEHAFLISDLPKIHKDPFDRIMIAQALYEDMFFLTDDKILIKYPGSIIYAGN